MDSFCKLAVPVAALVVALSFAWIALTITGMIPGRAVSIYHGGSVRLTNDLGGFQISNY
jgi:hypothetical protein